MKERTILGTGIVGSVVTAVCCFTPALPLALGALGLSAWLVWADLVLLPALALFLALTAYGLWRYRRAQKCGARQPPLHEGGG